MASNARGSVVSLTAAVSLGVAVFFTLYSLIPITRADEPGLSSVFVGTMMAFVMGVQVFTPALVRRFSLRFVLLGAFALLAVGALVTGWAANTSMLLVGAVASGSGFGTLIVAGALGVALLVAPDRLGRSLGTYGLITMAASALGSPAGVQLALTFSLPVFGVCAFVAGVLAIGLSLGLPGAVGRPHSDAASEPSSTPVPSRPRGLRGAVADAPWLVLTLLLVSVVLLSHGLSSLPVLASAFGSTAVVVFAVQGGNALGRGLGGELEARTSARATTIAGALLLAVGGASGVVIDGLMAIIVAGALIGLGVGIIQTVTLHAAMLRMDPGHASVVWNLGVDGGLWIGGIIWGLALSTDLAVPGALLFSALVFVTGTAVAIQVGSRRRTRSAGPDRGTGHGEASSDPPPATDS
ncbi:MFS transporter [Brachybacterium sp. ACRRE]|uniref:MFS transporter n=1 Tax=Brachybacterium sp. ACRRE TaxID=2918184 RepID=UPI001EF302EB|nr:MFS transporter [Brachybacterium sp. ACRRE]MCG7311082.1 MFS transporter [Brachybacterium sp. ACRRE]